MSGGSHKPNSVTAMAMGLSHSQIRVLLTIPLGAKACPSRSKIHRWVLAAGKAAGEVLKQLDHSCKALVLVGCLDEIFFHRKPVLVGVEPQSMTWFLGKKVASHQGSTWFAELQPWTSLSYVTSDAGAGLKAGIARIQKLRLETNQVPLEKGLDVFHTKREAHRALRIICLQLIPPSGRLGFVRSILYPAPNWAANKPAESNGHHGRQAAGKSKASALDAAAILFTFAFLLLPWRNRPATRKATRLGFVR